LPLRVTTRDVTFSVATSKTVSPNKINTDTTFQNASGQGGSKDLQAFRPPGLPASRHYSPPGIYLPNPLLPMTFPSLATILPRIMVSTGHPFIFHPANTE
jgi:hypothetical protein